MRSRRLSSLRACLSTSSGMWASVMALSSSAISAPPSSPSPSSFWIVRICSRSRCLRFRSPIDSRVRRSTSRETFSTSMRRASTSSTLSRRAFRSKVSSSACFSSSGMSIMPAMKSASCAGLSTPCRATASSAGTCGSSCRTSRARCLSARPRPSISVSKLSGSSMYSTRATRERLVVQELQHAKAPQALADDVVHALGRRDVAQHARTRADPVQVVGPWVVDIGLALKQHADGLLQAHRLLHRGARAFAADRQRQHHAREQHGVAHRHDEQRIRRQWPGRDQRLRGRVGCLSVGRVRLRRTHVGARVLVHGCASSIFRSLSVRHPWASSGEPISRRPRGNGMRRSKAP